MKLELKPKVIKELKSYPVVQVVCNKVGVGRATFYRWLDDDEVFKKSCKQALNEGVNLINDLAESKVIKGIEEGDAKMIRFWLNNRHYAYSFRDKTKVEDILSMDSEE